MITNDEPQKKPRPTAAQRQAAFRQRQSERIIQYQELEQLVNELALEVQIAANTGDILALQCTSVDPWQVLRHIKLEFIARQKECRADQQ